MKFFLLLVTLFLGTQAVSFSDLVHEQWTTFKIMHGKEYSSETEEEFRMKIFMENSHAVAKHNKLYAEGIVSYKLGINEYSDLLHHEFNNIMNGFNRTKNVSLMNNEFAKTATFIPPANVKVPNEVDWRKMGAVTDVKNQGYCGSCWSFSAVGSLEGQHFRQSGELVSLSTQNLVDCSRRFGNYGCQGGFPDKAFEYIKWNHGIDTEASYPYLGINDKCHYNPSTSGATDNGFVYIPTGNEELLKTAVATVGPISVAIDASQQSFRHYLGGLYYEANCDAQRLDHAVLVVGYGTEDGGRDYWIVKNSWGESWGENGYIKMVRNKGNNCGIATAASYPIV